MPRRNQIRIDPRPIADRYASPGERIIELSDNLGNGCLIRLAQQNDRLHLSVYRTEGVEIQTDPPAHP